MRKHAKLRAAQPGAIHQRCVAKLIEHDDVLGRDQGGNGADGGGVTAVEGEGGLRLLPIGQGALQADVRRLGSADEARRAGAHAEFVDRGDGRGAKARIIGQSEIIVRRKVNEMPAGDIDLRILRRLDFAQAAVK